MSYIDYDVYLENGFDAIAFANSLVRATNTASDSDVDLAAPAKRLQYDIDEVQGLISKLAAQHHHELLSQVQGVAQARAMLDLIKPSLDELNQSYKRLADKLLKPYGEAQTLHAALKRMHSTIVLLQQLTWYLHLAQQLRDSSMSKSADRLSSSVEAYAELRKQLEKHHALRSLQIVRQHEPSLDSSRSEMVRECLNTIGHFTLLKDRTALRQAVQALHILDRPALVKALKMFLSNQVGSSSTLISNSLVTRSTDHVGRALDQAREKARTLHILSSVLPEDDLVADADLPNGLVSEFWSKLASTIEARVRDARRTGSFVPTDQFKKTIRTTVADKDTGISENGPEATVVLNAFAS